MRDLTLAIDTTGDVGVGLAREGVAIAESHGPDRKHVELLIGEIRDTLASVGADLHDLTGLGVGVGPGPFTGLRVGIVTATTLGRMAGLPVKGVCSLDVLAAQWQALGAPGEFVISIDARRRELYWAHYRDGQRVGELHVSAPQEIPDLPMAGPGVDTYRELLATRRPADAPRQVSAGFLAASLDRLPDAGLEPIYLRKPDAELPRTRKSALASGRLRLTHLTGGAA